MCGIIGAAIARGNVAPLLRESLKRLEYRGYDSSGIATAANGVLHVKKDKGKIDEIDRKLSFDLLPGVIGIGHTRWATHGPPSRDNAHPHLDCQDRIAVVHNGIIENYRELRDALTSRGHVFRSETDTEVIPHLIEEALHTRMGLDRAVAKTLPKLEGSYALAVIDATGSSLVCARKESPLVIGLGDGGVYCASDVPAFLPMTRQSLVLEDGEMAHITADGALLGRLDSSGAFTAIPLRLPTKVKWTIDMAQKGGYPHFMLKEIHEQPRALRDTLRLRPEELEAFAGVLNSHETICMVAAGTSFNATLAARYMFSRIGGRIATPVIASEGSEVLADTVGESAAVLAVTQSGETIDTLHAVKQLKEEGSTILAITNTVGSSITRIADHVLYTQAGPEIGVAATKTFATQLACLGSLSAYLGQLSGTLSAKERSGFLNALAQFSDLAESIIRNQENSVKEAAQQYATKTNFFFLGRGISTATAMEGALKIKEIAYVHAEGYPAGESKHGPIALVEPGFPVVFVAPHDSTHRHLVGNVMEMKARGAEVIAVCCADDQELIAQSNRTIPMPPLPVEEFSPIAYVVPLQLLAYYAAILRGYNPDQPRNLAKAVTVL